MVRAAVITGVALAAVIVAVTRADGEAPNPEPRTVDTATTKIVRQDLVETETVDGTLGYADERTVTPKLPGTVTWLPEEGATITSDHRLLEVDGKGVYLLDGDVPAFRSLHSGLSGDDVRQLQRNLDVDDSGEWNDQTTEAVEDWQQGKGLPVTGTIELGRIVFQPGPRRIAATKATIGGPPAPLTTTATHRVVTVQLDTAKAELARENARVKIELPSGTTVAGRIESVGRVATQVKGTDPTVELTIRTSQAKGLDQAPVEVQLERGRRENALTIPVTALLARSGGGFAVEARENGTHRLIGVEPGLFASGDVEIEGDGLRAGMSVTNAAL